MVFVSAEIRPAILFTERELLPFLMRFFWGFLSPHAKSALESKISGSAQTLCEEERRVGTTTSKKKPTA